MVLIEWLIKTNINILKHPGISEKLKSLNGGYIKVIEKKDKETIIALPISPEEIKLPENIKRKKIKNEPSVYEEWYISE